MGFEQHELPENSQNYVVLPRNQRELPMYDPLVPNEMDTNSDNDYRSLLIPFSDLRDPKIWKGEIRKWQSLLFTKPYFDGFMGFGESELPFRFKVALYIDEQVASGAAGTYDLSQAYPILQSKGYTPEFNLTFYHATINRTFRPDPLLIDRYKFNPMLYHLFEEIVDLAATWRTGAILYIGYDIGLDPSQFKLEDFPEPKSPIQVREVLHQSDSGIFVGYRIDS